MGYLDKSGLSRLWSKIESYVTNHHMDMTPPQTHPMNPHNADENLSFGGAFSGSNYSVIGEVDGYGHITSRVQLPTFNLPTVEGGVVNVTGTTTVNFTTLKNAPKIIKVYTLDTNNSTHPHGLCTVWIDGENVVSNNGAVSDATANGFKFAGVPGEHYWEAWG